MTLPCLNAGLRPGLAKAPYAEQYNPLEALPPPPASEEATTPPPNPSLFFNQTLPSATL